MSLHQVFDYFVLHCLGERFDVEGEVPPPDDTHCSPLMKESGREANPMALEKVDSLILCSASRS